MSTVYVLNKDGKPLMPTTRGGHVRHLLKEQKARIVRTKPFTIQLLYETDDVVQPLYLGIDPGRTNIGVAVVKTDGTAVFTAHLETRNKEIPKLMKKRKDSRRARRTNGRRCRRQRRAKANGTISKKCVKQTTAQNGSVSKRAKEIGVIKRHLPGCVFLVGKHTHVMQGTSGSHNGKADGYYDTNGNSYSSGKCKCVAKNEGIVFT